MLVLSRKLNESIRIGPDIQIKILGIKGAGDQAVIRIGIEAPDDVQVLREELYVQLAAENRDAVHGASPEVLAGLGLEKLAKSKLAEEGEGSL